MAKKRLILFIALAIIILLIFLPGFSRYQRLVSEERLLRDRIRKLEESNMKLELERHKLENDIEYVEKRAREKLGVVKKDEIPYKIRKEGGE